MRAEGLRAANGKPFVAEEPGARPHADIAPPGTGVDPKRAFDSGNYSLSVRDGHRACPMQSQAIGHLIDAAAKLNGSLAFLSQ